MIKIKDMNLSVGKRMIASNITMELKKGGKYLLLGENGTGKSNLYERNI